MNRHQSNLDGLLKGLVVRIPVRMHGHGVRVDNNTKRGLLVLKLELIDRIEFRSSIGLKRYLVDLPPQESRKSLMSELFLYFRDKLLNRYDRRSAHLGHYVN